MDVTKYAESEYMNVSQVKAAVVKKAVFVDSGMVESFTYDGKQLEKMVFVVEFNGRRKKWSPNMDTLKNLGQAWGWESSHWVGKTVQLVVATMKGKEAILGLPVGEDPVGLKKEGGAAPLSVGVE